MMLDTAGGAAGGDQLSASVIDDFYASDAPDQHVFSGPVSPSASFNNEAVTQSHPPDELTHATHPAASPATVSLGGNTPDSVGLGGSLDGNKIPGGAKFAVSQIHGVYLALHRSVLSRCAPWSEFAMTSSFQRPGTGAAAVDRMERNMRYFATNYLCICGALGGVCALLNPSVLFLSALCGALCAFASFKGEVQIGDTTLSKRSFQTAVCACGACLLFLFAGNAVLTLLFVCCLIVAIHSALHKGVSYQTIAQKNAPPHADLGV
ncbi:PRA1 family protein B6 [Cyclospora cayetanensis]|uniref:PRA1 family protein n=1 Tax=Cyclospora cayetanensis TaxID=88456 RepID=A0A6P6S1R7_9EIME|nr:PRA1 family protein B6 [Cyclospora cayetanensis]